MSAVAATEANTTDATMTAAETPVQTGSKVLEFAKALAKEHAGAPGDKETPAPAAETDDTSSDATSTDIDIDAVRAAFDAGDVEALAKALGKDPADTKVGKSRWAEFRIEKRQATRALDAKRAEIDAAKAELVKEREATHGDLDTYRRVQQAVKNGDLEAAIELATGRKMADVIDELAAGVDNPAAREARKLRRELEETKAQQAAREKADAERTQSAQQAKAVAEYREQLSKELAEFEPAAPFVKEYGPEFVGLVFVELQRHFDGNATIPVERAARNVLRAQLAAFDRGVSHFEALRKALGGQSSGGPSKTAAQPARGGRLSPRKAATTAQSGTASTGEMSRQDRIAMFARQLKAENAS